MPVNYVRGEVTIELPRWQLIRDCVDGQQALKAKGILYLPMPNPTDKSAENKARYAQYVERALYYNVTDRTLNGLAGQVFLRDPLVEIPNVMDPLKVDVDGAGVGLDQQAKRSLRNVLAFGRTGLFVDYPPTESPTTKAQQTEGYIRPTITSYNAWDIINWRTTIKGARKLLSLVVLREEYVAEDDGYEAKILCQYRVLRLVENVYTVEIHREQEGKLGLYQKYVPLNSSGQPLDEIPFQIIGSENNDDRIDKSPIYDLATVNIAHYRNSADYEESCFLVGQPTPVLSGLTQTWVDTVLKGKVHLGSRAAIPLPADGSATLLQAQPNTIVYEAMEQKERQMVALGAKLVETTEVQRTFGEAQLEEAAETSILATSAKNVSAAYTDALQWAAGFMTGDGAEVKYELNTDFPATRMTPQDRAQLVAEWQGGAISFTEMRDQLRKVGVASLDDEEAQEEIDARPTGTKLASEPDPELLLKQKQAGGNK